MTTSPRNVLCPHCKKNVIWNSENQFRPFCCERCKLIDLGEWANEEKKIPGDSIQNSLENGHDALSYKELN